MPSTLPTSPPPAQRVASCRVHFGASGGRLDDGALHVALPLLKGEPCEIVLDDARGPTAFEDCTVFLTDRRIGGLVMAPPGADLEAAARDLYQRVFAATRGRHLYRIWNYVPHINSIEDGLENYRRFCRGRSLAFESEFGQAFRLQLPAASAVGATGGPLALAFLAGEAVPRHFENPQQVPAFEYPPAYGPRPPSFSRATLVDDGLEQDLFISGTAAIRGHASVATHNLAGQLACTRENLNVIAATAGAGPRFGAADGWRRWLKVYVRHAGDFQAVGADFEQHLLQPEDEVTYLQADLCRADLLVEVEAVLTRTA